MILRLQRGAINCAIPPVAIRVQLWPSQDTSKQGAQNQGMDSLFKQRNNSAMEVLREVCAKGKRVFGSWAEIHV